MRVFIIIFTLFMTVSFAGHNANAQTPISDDTSTAFFKNCIGNRDARMSEESQGDFCACSATKMQENMSMEESHTMFQQSQEGRNMLNKMLVTVYAPCMNFPVQDIVEMSCLNDPKVAALKLKGEIGDLCYCMGKQTGSWFSEHGPALLLALLKTNPNITDPITPIMESRVVKNESYKFLLACANNTP